jgi:hypothetical protein
MRTRPLDHRSRLVMPVLALAALLVLCASGNSLAAVTTVPKGKPKNPKVLVGPLTGTWTGTYSGAFSGNFTLRWTQIGSKLHGSITLSRPRGTYSIGGSVRRKAIRFGAVGAGATYSGTLSGSSMSGHYATPRGPGTWSATKN